MELLLATGNSHKAEEFRHILKGHRILIPGDLDLEFDYEETGTTFFENSYGKAMYLHRLSGKPVIADDSGLCVTALDGAPGIYSARYGAEPGKPDLSSEERNALLLSRMAGIKEREAFFVCAMVLVMGEHRFFAVQETVGGVIINEPRGTGGFGYDPLLYLPEKGLTIAEISAEEKNRISHRGLAGRRMAGIIASLAV